MIKNRITQLIFRVVFLTVSVFGILDSFGLYAGQSFGFECFLYYTSLSNFLCFGVMLAVVIGTAKAIGRGELEGHNSTCQRLKFYSTLIILVTFLVYNFVLADGIFEPGWNSVSNLTKHVVCPIMFVFDYLLFDKHHSLKWYDCLLCTVLPLVYVVVIMIRGAILPADYAGTLYPYFFLDAGELGYGGVALWVVILLAIFIVIAFLFFLYDKLEYKDKRLTFSLRDKG